ncbi:MAG: hypothetical protein ACXU96_16460 [Gemmatimonadaceae bacterium]
MKRAWFAMPVICAIAAAVACNPFAPDQSVVLDVEKIDAPASSPVGSPLTVVLTVTIGMCESFDHIGATSTASGASLTAWGLNATIGNKDIVCPTIIKSESHSYQFKPSTRGSFQITVDRGSVSPLTATVQVQ